MDLYEIRKKAREKKEAEEKAAAEKAAQESAAQPAGGDADTEPVSRKPKPVKPRKKGAGGKSAGPKSAKGRGKAKEPPEPVSEPAEDAAMQEAPRVDSEVGLEEPAEAAPVSEPLAEELAEPVQDESEDSLDALMQQAFESEVAGDAGGEAVVPPETAEEPVRSEPPQPVAEEKGEEQPEQGPVTPAEDEDYEDENIVEYLAFLLASEEYAVRVSDIKEIIRPQKITMVPRAPEFVEGIFSLRGVIIPVFDIKKRLGFENTDRDRGARILIVSDGGDAQGIIVDRVTGVARLKADSIEPPPNVIGGVEAEYLEGIGRLDGRLLILFNTARVLSMEG